MHGTGPWGGADVFTTCPAYAGEPVDDYMRRVSEVARWSEEAGCKGILIYTDNSVVDPWLLAQVILQTTKSLSPLVAVQPIYMHPFEVAKMVSSLGYLYGRRICLNMVAGGFKNDLIALNDTTPHDKRYERLLEYTIILKSLLMGGAPVSFTGQFYRVDKLTLRPPLPTELFPHFLSSGSSDAGVAAARAMGATPVKYPEPPQECQASANGHSGTFGVRTGIISHQDEERAWAVAYARFPADRKGQLTRQLATKVSDSTWHKQLSDLGKKNEEARSPYWLVPFEIYKTNCPYLVGSYDQLATELNRFAATGCDTYILDVPTAREELDHIARAFERARATAFAPAAA